MGDCDFRAATEKEELGPGDYPTIDWIDVVQARPKVDVDDTSTFQGHLECDHVAFGDRQADVIGEPTPAAGCIG